MTRQHVAIMDFGMGNLFNLQRAIVSLGYDTTVTSDPKEVASADRLIIPGVGAFPRAIEEIKKRGLLDGVQRFLAAERPGLGICLGMQILFSRSYEFGEHEGLGVIHGSVVRFRSEGDKGVGLKIPQVGWNTIHPTDGGGRTLAWKNGILADLAPGTPVYFVHSFYCRPENSSLVVAETTYGNDRYCSVVNQGTLWGCQFHPERSARNGLQILKNFICL